MSFRKSGTNLVHHTPEKVNAPTQQTDVLGKIQSVMKYAGMATEHFTNVYQERVAKDALVQQSRTAQGLLPTSDATKGGYKAATALALSLEADKSEVRLTELAKQDLSDEEWEAALANENSTIKQALAEKYPHMAQDATIQEMIMRDEIAAIPKLTVQREVSRLEREKQEQDNLISEKILLSAVYSDEDFGALYAGLATQMGRSEAGIEQLLVKTARESKSPELVAKIMKLTDSKGNSVADKYGDLRNQHDQNMYEEARNNAGKLADEIHYLETALRDGSMTGVQFNDYVNFRNEETSGAFMTPAKASSIKEQIEKERAADVYRQRISNAMITGSGDISGLSKADQQIAALHAYDLIFKDELSKLPEADQGTSHGYMKAQLNAVNKTAEIANRSGVYVEQWSDNAKILSRTNMDNVVVKDEKGTETFTPQFQLQLNQVLGIPIDQRDAYMSGDTAKIINAYELAMEAGASPVAAFKQAQLSTRSMRFTNTGELFEASKKIVNSAFNNWFDADIPSSQKMMAQGKIQEHLRSQYPNADVGSRAVRNQVEKWAEKNTTQLEDGSVLFANKTSISSQMGINENHISRAIAVSLENRRGAIEDKLSWIGGSIDSVYWDIDTKTGRASLLNEYGIPISGSTVSLKDIGDEFRNWEYEAYRESKKAAAAKVERAATLSSDNRHYNWK